MRKMLKRYHVGSFLVGLVGLSCPASAQDASFGCKVFMCVASGNWQSIEYCVPYVTTAIAQAQLGIPWPVCTEALSGAVSQGLQSGNSQSGG
jgi:hypothetical protein